MNLSFNAETTIGVLSQIALMSLKRKTIFLISPASKKFDQKFTIRRFAVTWECIMQSFNFWGGICLMK